MLLIFFFTNINPEKIIAAKLGWTVVNPDWSSSWNSKIINSVGLKKPSQGRVKA